MNAGAKKEAERMKLKSFLPSLEETEVPAKEKKRKCTCTTYSGLCRLQVAGADGALRVMKQGQECLLSTDNPGYTYVKEHLCT